jgi:hypothetical protein
MTPDEQGLYIEKAKAHIASRRSESERCFEKNREDWLIALKEVDELPQPDEGQLRRIALRLKRRNESGIWSRFGNTHHLVGWLRHRGVCVYCGKDLIEQEYIRHGWATTDHLLPQSSYGTFDRCSLNTLPACSACNCLKGGFDPSQSAEAASEG